MKYIITLIISLCLSHALLGQYSFELTIASDEDETFYDAIEDTNADIVLVGRIGDLYNLDWDPYILKIYPNGDTMSKRIASADTNGWFQNIELLNDGNYMLFGKCITGTDIDYDKLWLCKMDTALNVIFHKTYNVLSAPYTRCHFSRSHTDTDHNIILSGGVSYDSDQRNENGDFIFVKCNQQGDTLLTKTQHFEFGQQMYDITQIPNTTDYLGVGGFIDMHNFGPIRLDSAFNIKQIRHFYSQISILGCMHWLTDTSYLFAACNYVFGSDEQQVGTYIIDTALNYQKQLILGKIDTVEYPAYDHSIGYVNDTTIYIGAQQIHPSWWITRQNVLELYVIDRELNLLGHKDFTDPDARLFLNGILPTADMGCLFYGARCAEENQHEYDVKIIKVLREDIEIEISPITVTSELVHQINAKAYPNPAREVLNIPLSKNIGLENTRIQIFDMNGKKISDRLLNGQGNVLQVSLSTLRPGMYFYTILSKGEKPVTGKFIKN